MFCISGYACLLKLNRLLSINLTKSFSIVNPNLSTCSPISQYLKPLNSKITFYMRNGQVQKAQNLFDEMPHKNTVTWNAMIRGYFQNEQSQEALSLFSLMPERDLYTYNILISGLINCGDINSALAVFDGMSFRDVVTWNSIIAGYFQAGFVDEAMSIFNRMPLEMRDVVSWNNVLLELVRNGNVKAAHGLLEKLPYGNVVSSTNLLVGYFRNGEVSTAIKLFKLLPADPDTTVWNVMICGLGENGHCEEGLKIFLTMKELGLSTNKSTFTSVLTICSDLSASQLGEQIHAEAMKTGFHDLTAVSNAMVTMYARCGNLHSALQEFSSMPSHNIISWNSIICGFAHHGFGEKAIEMFEKMRLADVKPNHITFVGVLSACSHAGLVDQGRYYFDYMINKCHLQPTDEHFTSLVDLLGRFGLINEAMAFVHQMREDGMEIPRSVWGALLGACRIHKNIAIAEIAGERLLEIEPTMSAIYLILAELYVSAGKREEAEKILNRMSKKGVKKQPGCSWIEVNNNWHVFLSGDSSRHEFSRICSVLDLLRKDKDSMILKYSTGLLEQP
ncbi:pentatricopeptide repeat-containing protein At4g02750-like [Euphorbia lathyris]|uniref:pentatricopeptide repeat-containing protein At4g02750-like n=1 Tax=Euphorbia lathyris TaxID=212925 RepID=UPI0033132993